MQKLLDILDCQVTIMVNGGQPDYGLLIEIAGFFRNFPDLFHHPKEELILRYLIQRKAPGVEHLLGLTGEHEEGSIELSRFTHMLVDLLMEPVAAREAFVAAATSFIANERRHIEWEEQRFFEIASTGLGANDWSEIREKIDRLKEPVYANFAGAHMPRLAADIERWRHPSAG